jgi:exopolyphosphatase/guanosine-5'-triphosphate,3'-diphosphate pyrophosphatase
MRIAVIDLGTNSVRFDIREIASDGSIRRLYRERLMVKLGQGVFETGRLHPAAQKRTVQAFITFRMIGDRYGVEKFIAVGTSALRDAKGAAKFVKRVKERTGILIKIISGAEEARYIAQGFVANDSRAKSSAVLLVDIGGGSTEFTLIKPNTAPVSVSLNIGAARLHQLFLNQKTLRGSPPTSEVISSLRSYIRSSLARIPLLQKVKGVRCIGSSGTIRAVCKLAKKGADSITPEALSLVVHTLIHADRKTLYKIPRLEQNRVDLIVPGAILLEEIVNLTNPNKLETTEYSLRDGIIEDVRKTVSRPSVSYPQNAIKMRIVHACKGIHVLDDWTLFSETVFEKLIPAHRLSKRWKELYSIAQTLHPIAEILGDFGRDGPMAKLVADGALVDLDLPTRKILALLFTLRQGGKIRSEDFPLEPQKVPSFYRLLAMTRLLYALQTSFSTPPKITRIKVSSHEAAITLKAGAAVDVALLRIETVQETFRAACRKFLQVRFS